MNSLIVPYVAFIDYYTPADILTDLFSSCQSHKLSHEPWPEGYVKPLVEFKIIYGDDSIFLNFLVKEKYFRAIYTYTNEPVWKDSCVEFFIALDDNGTYYNFEFNALGTKLVAFGEPNNRHQLNIELVDTIKCFVTYHESSDAILSHNWELIAIIPFSIFGESKIKNLTATNCRGNFYKCGDDLPKPHFLCWNNILAPKPNFHLPEFFGKLIFE